MVIPPPVNPVPAHLLAPCPVPAFTVWTWGEYPEYVARLHLALEKCNADKQAVASILVPSTTPPTKEKTRDGIDNLQKGRRAD